MIESTIINALKADTDLVALLTTFNNSSAIFSELAPESAVKPYAVISVTLNSPDYTVIQNFRVLVDIYDHDQSRVNSREAAERVRFIFDEKIFEHERYQQIRFKYFGGSPIPELDPRDIHYNTEFQARAIRKKWIIQH